MRKPKIVDVNKGTKRITLSKTQLLWHYSVVIFFLIVPVISIWHIVQYYVSDDYKGVRGPKELAIISIGFVFVALAFFFLQRRRLTFKEYTIPCTDKAFELALKKTSKELKWKVIKRRKGYVRAYRDWNWSASWGELITIKREGGRILINSICNPEAIFISVISYGWNRKNVRTFIDNLDQSTNADVVSVDK